jgi:hypothetical protein
VKLERPQSWTEKHEEALRSFKKAARKVASQHGLADPLRLGVPFLLVYDHWILHQAFLGYLDVRDRCAREHNLKMAVMDYLEANMSWIFHKRRRTFDGLHGEEAKSRAIAWMQTHEQYAYVDPPHGTKALRKL